MKTCISIDLDNFEDYRSLVDPHGDPTGPSFYAAVPRFLDALDRVGARATFFAIGRDLRSEANRSALREIAARGHEVGNHSHTHPYDFCTLSRAGKREEIGRCESAIADTLGERPVGFRAPSGDVDGETHEILAERGYHYDASLTPTPLLWLFMLYARRYVERERYRLGRPAYALAPTHPYLPRAGKLHRPRGPGRGDGPALVEIPISALPGIRIPFYGTLLRRLGIRGFDVLTRLHPTRWPLHVGFHALDLMDLRGTSLGRALARRPGLSVPFERRERFVAHAFGRLAGLGESATLREIAATSLEPRDLRRAA
jgi:peptidoglycan/xylan/chitin deacetylase (PgdA/CDA1 family)